MLRPDNRHITMHRAHLAVDKSVASHTTGTLKRFNSPVIRRPGSRTVLERLVMKRQISLSSFATPAATRFVRNVSANLRMSGPDTPFDASRVKNSTPVAALRAHSKTSWYGPEIALLVRCVATASRCPSSGIPCAVLLATCPQTSSNTLSFGAKEIVRLDWISNSISPA